MSGVVTIADASKIDYETSTGHDITVRAVNGSGAHGPDQNFHFDVLDVEDSFLMGRSLGYQYRAPGLNNIVHDFGSVLVTNSVELDGITQPGGFGSVDFTKNQIIFNFDDTGDWASASFRGVYIYDIDGMIPFIHKLTLENTNMVGFTQQRISWSSDSIFIDFEGLHWTPGSTVISIEFF
jgi:hypothetical protein